MNRRIQERLERIQAEQIAGKHRACPRCGRDSMQDPPTRNALSRICKLYVCGDCGMDEAKLAFMRNPGTLYGWAAFQPEKPESDFPKTECAEAWRRIQERWAEEILRLYRRFGDGELDSDDARFEAFETLPGLTQIWTRPFMLRFDCADGYLLVQARENGGRTELIANRMAD